MQIIDNPLVSIIIPTYNRGSLISETLDSILAQTYNHWECIVVDDDSTDNTGSVMQKYLEKDARFKYYQRPSTHLSGGNGARNYGFEMSQGDYIQWFDSDDLMVPEKLEVKINTIKEFDVDFVISKTTYFNKENHKQYTYDYREEDVDFLSYTTTHISWFTPDMFLKRDLAKKVKFNETIKAGQEYNFSCKMLLETKKLKKIDEFLTLRRFHDNSIGKKRQLNRKHFWQTTFELHWKTLNELKHTYEIPTSYEKFALLKCAKSYLKNTDIKLPKKFNSSLLKFFGIRSIYFYLAILFKALSGNYYYFYKQLKKH